MTAQVEFFCSPEEERKVVEYLTKEEGTKVYNYRDGQMVPWDGFSLDDIPEWSQNFSIFLWQPQYGSLIFHDSQPEISGPTHRSLVLNLFAREHWDSQNFGELERMLDHDLSPVMIYFRGIIQKGKRGQNLLLSPPSNLNRVGPEYEKWVKRTTSWIRRQGKIVHDWRKQSQTLPNPWSIVNTIYAFPDVYDQLQSTDPDFEIMLGD